MIDQVQDPSPPVAPAADRDPPPEVEVYRDRAIALAVAEVRARQEAGRGS